MRHAIRQRMEGGRVHQLIAEFVAQQMFGDSTDQHGFVDDPRRGELADPRAQCRPWVDADVMLRWRVTGSGCFRSLPAIGLPQLSCEFAMQKIRDLIEHERQGLGMDGVRSEGMHRSACPEDDRNRHAMVRRHRSSRSPSERSR